MEVPDPVAEALRDCIDSRTSLNTVLENFPDDIQRTILARVSKACLHWFVLLTRVLITKVEDDEHLILMPPQEVQGQFDRFKVWCGNLAASQIGRSSLDARLRESSVMRENVLNNVARLYQTLFKSWEIVSGIRQPLEKIASPNFSEDFSDNDGEGDESDESDPPPRELAILTMTIKDIMSGLYKLSFHIRNTKTRSSIRSTLYTEIDDETGNDKFDEYITFDRGYVQEILVQLRRESNVIPNGQSSAQVLFSDADEFLIDRLVSTMNMRRRMLRYWRRHSKKLALAPREPIESTRPPIIASTPHSLPQNTLAGVGVELPTRSKPPAPSLFEGTILSQTDVTLYDKGLDDRLDTQSVVSYASTSASTIADQVSIPSPPKLASQGTEFVCPYCAIVCPSRQGRGRSWIKHITQDLQPYICTYKDCASGKQMYGSRSAWLEHESQAHRSIWQCYRHADTKFSSSDKLRYHLNTEHRDEADTNVIENLLVAARLGTADAREQCPFCLSRAPFRDGLDVHMAIHMQVFANFCIPRHISGIDDEVDDRAEENKSDEAQGLGSDDSHLTGSLRFDSEPASILDEDVKELMPDQSQTMTEAEAVLAGIDPEYLQALPSDMRDEVLQELTRARRSEEREAAPGRDSTATVSTLQAIAHDHDNDGQEAASRGDANTDSPARADDIDPVTFLATLDPALRRQLLMDIDDEALSALPPELQAEARSLSDPTVDSVPGKSSKLVDLSENLDVARQPKVLVMGESRAGKTFFIKSLAGRDFADSPDDGTEACQLYPVEVENTKLLFVDTPTLDISGLPDASGLADIARVLSTVYEIGVELKGVIYLHRISNVRYWDSEVQTFEIFRRICGYHALKNVLLVTSRWDEIEPALGLIREQQLRDSIWAPLVEKGSRISRFDGDRNSALLLAAQLINQEAVVLELQRELVDQGMNLNDTAAGSIPTNAYKQAAKRFEEDMAELTKRFQEIREGDENVKHNIEIDIAREETQLLRAKKREAKLRRPIGKEVQKEVRQQWSQQEPIAAGAIRTLSHFVEVEASTRGVLASWFPGSDLLSE